MRRQSFLTRRFCTIYSWKLLSATKNKKKKTNTKPPILALLNLQTDENANMTIKYIYLVAKKNKTKQKVHKKKTTQQQKGKAWIVSYELPTSQKWLCGIPSKPPLDCFSKLSWTMCSVGISNSACNSGHEESTITLLICLHCSISYFPSLQILSILAQQSICFLSDSRSILWCGTILQFLEISSLSFITFIWTFPDVKQN